MVSVKIIRGTFGWNHDGRYDLVPAGSEPIEVGVELANRLIENGVAERVSAAPVSLDTEAHGIDGMSVKELRELGRERGITFKVGVSKADMIEAIQAAENDQSDAPEFDASEAIQ